MTSEFAQSRGKTGHIAANLHQGELEQESERCGSRQDISEEVHEDEDELHAWCSLEEGENEQWQEVSSKKASVRNQN